LRAKVKEQGEHSMAQITIEVPDALVNKISTIRDRLPEVLARGLSEPSTLLNEAYRSVLTFLTGNPSPEEMGNFKLAPQIQEHISELLEKNRAGQLTAMEETELDEYGYINRLVSSLKARALKDLKAAS
jgi:hypothetical protein